MPTLQSGRRLEFRAGTRVAHGRRDRKPQQLFGDGLALVEAIADALQAFHDEFSTPIPVEDLHITVAFSTTTVLVEVADFKTV